MGCMLWLEASIMLRDLGFTYADYVEDLREYFRLMDELEHCFMLPGRRYVLECARDTASLVLDMYELDFR